MALPIISAAQRLSQKQGVKLVLLGKSGIGKTSQLKTLPEASTLFVDLEAGDLAVRDWQGVAGDDVIDALLKSKAKRLLQLPASFFDSN